MRGPAGFNLQTTMTEGKMNLLLRWLTPCLAPQLQSRAPRCGWDARPVSRAIPSTVPDLTNRSWLLASSVAFSASLLAACGGGGGGGAPTPPPTPAPTPTPTPTPTPSPPPPPTVASIDSSRVGLAQIATLPCPTPACFGQVNAYVDSSGESTVFWTELSLSGPNKLVAANIASSGTAPLSMGTIESGFVSSQLFRARAVTGRRFALLHGFAFGSPPVAEIRSRVVDLKATGTPDVAAAVTLPSSLQPQVLPPVPPKMYQDGTGQLYTFTSDPAPSPPAVHIGTGVMLQPVRRPTIDVMAQYETAREADFPQSADPRILWGRIGREQVSEPLSAYIVEQRLTTGALLPPLKMSTQPLVMENSSVTCRDEEIEPASYVAAGPAIYAMPWRQLNAAGDACELYVSGRRVSDGTRSVFAYRINADGNGITAVWDERPSAGGWRVLWSRMEAVSSTWSVPAGLSSVIPASAGVNQQIRLLVRGPDGAMLAVWSSGLGTGVTYLSKYHNGTWTTVQLTAEGSGARSAAINAAGQAVAVFERQVQCAANSGPIGCMDLSVYRFLTALDARPSEQLPSSESAGRWGGDNK